MKQFTLTAKGKIDESLSKELKKLIQSVQSGEIKREAEKDFEGKVKNFKVSIVIDKDVYEEKSHQQLCKEFADTFEVNLANTDTNRRLQFALLLEEVIELGVSLGIPRYDIRITSDRIIERVCKKAESDFSRLGTLDALVDMEYFMNQIKIMTEIQEKVYDAAFRMVHQANMDKLVDGSVLRSDGTDGLPVGKVKKPPYWKPADLSVLFE